MNPTRPRKIDRHNDKTVRPTQIKRWLTSLKDLVSGESFAAPNGEIHAALQVRFDDLGRPGAADPRRKTVAVLGGGSVGVSFLHQLIQQMSQRAVKPAPTVLLFEPRARPGAGQAYEDDLACNLLNTRADTMSPVFGDPLNFLTWLTDNQDSWRRDFPDVRLAPEEFLPRPLFGRYLEAVYREAIARGAAQGVSVTHVRESVTDLASAGTRMRLQTTTGRAFGADIVVLATGNMPSVAFEHLQEAPGYFNSPYPGTMLASSIGNDAPVAVIGTNLSAIDTAVSLAYGGHTGKIVCVSRNGRLPSVRGVKNRKHKLQFLTREGLADLRRCRGRVTLDDLAMLLVKEAQSVDGRTPDMKVILNADAGVYDYLSSEIAEAATTCRNWQSVVYATNGIIEHIWHSLDSMEKQRFVRNFRSLWFSYRVSFPFSNARTMRELMRRDRVQISGGFRDVHFDRKAKRFRLSLRDPRSGLESSLATPFLVNATSASTDVTSCSLPIVRSLLKSGLAVADEFGGFQQEFETGRVRDRAGRATRPIYALGALATGTYFWTNAMDVNTRLASMQANVIAATLAEESASRVDPGPASRHGERGNSSTSTSQISV